MKEFEKVYNKSIKEQIDAHFEAVVDELTGNVKPEPVQDPMKMEIHFVTNGTDELPGPHFRLNFTWAGWCWDVLVEDGKLDSKMINWLNDKARFAFARKGMKI